MKMFKTVAVSFVVSLALASAADARVSTQSLTESCKTEAQSRYVEDQVKARMKFKGVTGPSNSRQIKLLVLPKDAEKFRTNCRFNAKTGELLSIERDA